MVEQDGKRFTIVTAPLPPLADSTRAARAKHARARHRQKSFASGMPFFRQEEQLEADGIELDRGTMARSTEDVGTSLGAIVLACVDDARKHAFCLSTDATGVAIRPEPLPDGRRQPCRKGHFFVVLADKKHVFFEFQPKHTSAAVCEMFPRLLRLHPSRPPPPPFTRCTRCSAVTLSKMATHCPSEVACWAHARRRLWEAAVSGFAIGREGLLRVRKLYELDQALEQTAASGTPPESQGRASHRSSTSSSLGVRCSE